LQGRGESNARAGRVCSAPAREQGLRGARLIERQHGAFSQRRAEATYTFGVEHQDIRVDLSIVSSLVATTRGNRALPTSRSIERESSVSCFGSPGERHEGGGHAGAQKD